MGQIKYILITGSSGFLGGFIIPKIIQAGFKPVLYLRANSNTSRINDLLNRCEIYQASGSEDDMKVVFNLYPIDCVVHLATEYGRGKSLVELLNTNIVLPISLLEEGKKNQLKLFINTDSFFAKKQYGQQYLKDYTSSKRILEQLLISFEGNVKIANLRLEHVYGENDSKEKFFSSILKKLLRNEAFIELTSGKQMRDFIYAEDVADAYVSVIENFEKLLDYSEFEIGTGIAITLRSFVEKLARAVKGKTELRFGALPTRTGDIEKSFADLENLKKIGWSHKYNIDEAIENIIKKEKNNL